MANTGTNYSGSAASVVVPAAAAGAGTTGVGAAAVHAHNSHSAAVAAALAALIAYVIWNRARVEQVLVDLHANATLAGSGVGAKQVGADDFSELDWELWQPGGPEAAQYLRDGKLRTALSNEGIVVQGLTDSALDRMADTLAGGLEGGLSSAEIAQELSDIICDPKRAETIARTETARAMGKATLDYLQWHGVMEWDWLTDGDPCAYCIECETNSPYPIGGGPAFPGHPNCRCQPVPHLGGTKVTTKSLQKQLAELEARVPCDVRQHLADLKSSDLLVRTRAETIARQRSATLTKAFQRAHAASTCLAKERAAKRLAARGAARIAKAAANAEKIEASRVLRAAEAEQRAAEDARAAAEMDLARATVDLNAYKDHLATQSARLDVVTANFALGKAMQAKSIADHMVRRERERGEAAEWWLLKADRCSDPILRAAYLARANGEDEDNDDDD